MDLDRALRVVRGLTAKADNLEALGDEASLHDAAECRRKADEIMQKHGAQDWQQKHAQKSFKPERVKIDIGQGGSPFLTETATLCNVVAEFCNCSSIWMQGSGFFVSEEYQRSEFCYVYGYESDLRYFELLFTTLYLHMSGAIFPKPDLTKSVQENAYELRNSGLNWIEIAVAYGWHEVPRNPGEAKNVYVNTATKERAGWSRAVGAYERAYMREVKERGEQRIRITPNGAMTYRRNAAQGYLARIDQRLRGIKGQRGTGAEIMLADKSQNIRAQIDDDFPDARTNKARKVRFDPNAYRRGVQHADTASLNPEATAGSSQPAATGGSAAAISG